MVWSKFSIKIGRGHFGNFPHDHRICDKIHDNLTQKIHIWNRMQPSLRGKKQLERKSFDQIHGTQVKYILFQNVSERKLKKEKTISPRAKKKRSPRHIAQLFIWKGRLGILNIDTQQNSLKIKWIQRLLNPTNAVWKDLILYRLNLILNSNQSLALLRQTQILRSTRHRNLKNKTKMIFYTVA